MNIESSSSAAQQPVAPLPWYREILVSLANFSTLSKLLRLIGAAVILAALSIYLLQGWQNGDDIQRYLLMLAHTGLLAGIGFLCSHLIREPKGARLFLGLALISGSVCFAILGGLWYSQIQWDVVAGVYPAFTHWQAAGLGSVLLASLATFALLVPIAKLAFLAFARRSSLDLTGLFIASNAMLLIPVRSPVPVGLAILALVLTLLWQLAGKVRQDPTLNSFEGRFAQAIQFLPIAILALRGLTLYAVEAFFVAVVAISLFIVFRQLALSIPSESRWRKIIELSSLLPALFAAAGLTSWISELLPEVVLLPLFALSFAALIIEISLRSSDCGPALRRLASAVIMLGMVCNLVLIPGAAAAIFCILAGIAVLIYGFSAQQRTVFILGLLMLLIGLAYQLQLVVAQFDFGNWGALAALGVAAVIIGSVLERHGAVLKHRIVRWLSEYRSWQY